MYSYIEQRGWNPRNLPPGNWEIDWSHPASFGLIFCSIPTYMGTFTNLVTGELGVAGSVASAVVPKTGLGLQGPAFKGSLETTPCVDFDNPAIRYGIVDRYTLMSYQSISAAGGTPGNIMDQDNNTGSPRVFQWRFNNSGPSHSFIIFDTLGNVISTPGTVSLAGALNGYVSFGAIDDDGVRTVTGEPNIIPNIFSNVNPNGARGLNLSTKLTLFNVNGGNVQPFIGDLYCACIWRVPVPLGIRLWMINNPFGFLKPAHNKSMLNATAGVLSRPRGLIYP